MSTPARRRLMRDFKRLTFETSDMEYHCTSTEWQSLTVILRTPVTPETPAKHFRVAVCECRRCLLLLLLANNVGSRE